MKRVIHARGAVSLHRRARSAAAVLQGLGLTQQQVAQALGASQSQVSRILAGRLGHASKLFEAVCVYAETRAAGRIPREAVVRNVDLVDALAQTWDGTTEHAKVLAAGIRALAAARNAEAGLGH